MREDAAGGGRTAFPRPPAARLPAPRRAAGHAAAVSAREPRPPDRRDPGGSAMPRDPPSFREPSSYGRVALPALSAWMAPSIRGTEIRWAPLQSLYSTLPPRQKSVFAPSIARIAPSIGGTEMRWALLQSPPEASPRRQRSAPPDGWSGRD